MQSIYHLAPRQIESQGHTWDILIEFCDLINCFGRDYSSIDISSEGRFSHWFMEKCMDFQLNRRAFSAIASTTCKMYCLLLLSLTGLRAQMDGDGGMLPARNSSSQPFSDVGFLRNVKPVGRARGRVSNCCGCQVHSVCHTVSWVHLLACEVCVEFTLHRTSIILLHAHLPTGN